MESPRLPRFKRVSVPTIHLTERDHKIIRLIHRHRFLRSSHLVDLLGGSKQQVLRRLHLLFHHGYLVRPRAQLEYFHQGGSRPLVYGLGRKGVAVLRAELGEDAGKGPGKDQHQSVGQIFLEHTLLVSDLMVSLELACRQSGTVRLLHEDDLPAHGRKSKHHDFHWRVNVSPGLKLSVVPDRVFALESPDQTGHPTRQHFFLEADRGTMPVRRKSLVQTSFFRKLLAYEATWTQGLHQKRFGLHRFRVLTVTASRQRVHSLVQACGALKRGHGLFLFTNQPAFESAENLFHLTWQTGRPGETTTLLS